MLMPNSILQEIFAKSAEIGLLLHPVFLLIDHNKTHNSLLAKTPEEGKTLIFIKK